MLLKRFFIIVFLLTLPVSFALARGTQEAEEDKVTIELFNYVDAAAPEGQIWEEVKAAFLAAHPDIAINEESAYGEPYHQKASARRSRRSTAATTATSRTRTSAPGG